MDKPTRFRCEGCGRVMTVEQDGQDTIDSHKNVHGLVINIGPEPDAVVTDTQYSVQGRNPDGEWHDLGVSARIEPATMEAAQEYLDYVRRVLRKASVHRYQRLRIMTTTTTQTPGQEVGL